MDYELIYAILMILSLAPFISGALVGIYYLMDYALYVRCSTKEQRHYDWLNSLNHR